MDRFGQLHTGRGGEVAADLRATPGLPGRGMMPVVTRPPPASSVGSVLLFVTCVLIISYFSCT